MQAIYILNLISPLIYTAYARLSRLDKNLQNKIILFLYSVQVILMVGTRTLTTGADTINYYNFYEKALFSESYENVLNYFEPLFSLIGIISARMGLSFVTFDCIIAGLTMFFFSKAVEKCSSEVTISIYLYIIFGLFHNMMNQVRQALAMMIILYALTFLNEEKKAKFLVYVLLASLIHTSSLIVLVLLLVHKMKINLKTIFLYFTVSIMCAVFCSFIFEFITKYFSYGGYLEEDWRYGAFDINAILNFFVRLVMLILAMLFIRELNQKNRKINLYYHMIWICTVFQTLTVFNNAMGRITTYFFLGYLIIIPEIISNSLFFKNNKKILYPILIVGFLLYYLVYNGVLSGNEMDYKSTWF